MIVIFALGGLLLPPLIGAWIKWGGLPPGFAIFPPLNPEPQPGFSLPYFLVFAAIGIVILLALLFPQLFGFRKPKEKPEPFTRRRLPWWFWSGLVSFVFFFVLMAWPIVHYPQLISYSFLPLWWGFIVMLDGIVYARSGGQSLFARKPLLMLGSAVFSIGGWGIYEYFNYFVLNNWYYPLQGIFPHWFNLIWFPLTYTTVWPALFEWFTLIETFHKLRVRFSEGPKIPVTKVLAYILLFSGLALSFLVGLDPYPFFWAVWMGPLLFLLGLLEVNGVWTPITDVAKGDWTALYLTALASFFNGFCWENWNWLSQAFHFGVPENPNDWVYHLPYVNVIHLFAEMPLLGFLGYLPFGVLSWVLWLAFIQAFPKKIEFRLIPPGDDEPPAGHT